MGLILRKFNHTIRHKPAFQILETSLFNETSYALTSKSGRMKAQADLHVFAFSQVMNEKRFLSYIGAVVTVFFHCSAVVQIVIF